MSSKEKSDFPKLPMNALTERSRRTVKIRRGGTNMKDMAARCEMSPTTVIGAVKAYEVGSWRAVGIDRGDRLVGSGRTLTAEQQRDVQRLIQDRTPDQLQMVYAP
jgi:transposase